MYFKAEYIYIYIFYGKNTYRRCLWYKLKCIVIIFLCKPRLAVYIADWWRIKRSSINDSQRRTEHRGKFVYQSTFLAVGNKVQLTPEFHHRSVCSVWYHLAQILQDHLFEFSQLSIKIARALYYYMFPVEQELCILIQLPDIQVE